MTMYASAFVRNIKNTFPLSSVCLNFKMTKDVPFFYIEITIKRHVAMT